MGQSLSEAKGGRKPKQRVKEGERDAEGKQSHMYKESPPHTLSLYVSPAPSLSPQSSEVLSRKPEAQRSFPLGHMCHFRKETPPPDAVPTHMLGAAWEWLGRAAQLSSKAESLVWSPELVQAGAGDPEAPDSGCGASCHRGPTWL